MIIYMQIFTFLSMALHFCFNSAPSAHRYRVLKGMPLHENPAENASVHYLCIILTNFLGLFRGDCVFILESAKSMTDFFLFKTLMLQAAMF